MLPGVMDSHLVETLRTAAAGAFRGGPILAAYVHLGYPRRLWIQAYTSERLDVLLDGHDPRTLVLGRRDRRVFCHPSRNVTSRISPIEWHPVIDVDRQAW